MVFPQTMSLFKGSAFPFRDTHACIYTHTHTHYVLTMQ